MTIVTRARKKHPAATPPLRNITTAIEQQLGPIELWPLDRLHAYERNARVHPERQMAHLVVRLCQTNVACGAGGW